MTTAGSWSPPIAHSHHTAAKARAGHLRDTIWLGGQVPSEPGNNSGRRVLNGELLPQTRFTMSYIEDLLRPFGRPPARLLG